MSDGIEEIFDRGELVRPTDQQPNLVHLVRALAHVGGVPEIEQTSTTRQLIELIGTPQHLVFVLLDGLGMNIVRRLPQQSFLRRHLQMEMQATSPSTTACALTSVATAEYPGGHGVTGWFTHLPEYRLTATMLPFVERFTNQPLIERGIHPRDVLPLAAFQSRMTRDSLTLLPYLITHTAYARYSRGDTPAHGYASYHHAVDLVISHVTSAPSATYTHLYLPEVDTLCHKVGVNHPDVVSLVMRIDAEMARLATALEQRGRLVISADHGLIDVAAENQTLLTADDPLLPLLEVPPSGDARMPLFHVKPQKHAAFADAFERRFNDRMILLNIETVDRLRLFRPSGPMAAHARRRFGDFVAVACRAASLSFHPPNKPLGNLHVGLHAGLSPQEMIIPLIVF